jgi:anti-anti-sigma factor
MADDLFIILEEKSVRILEFRLRPEMDAMLFDSLMAAVAMALDQRAGGAWVVDLSKVDYLSSAGLGLLVNIRQKIRQGKGKLALCGLSPRLIELFRSCCLERLFLILKTRDQATKEVAR